MTSKMGNKDYYKGTRAAYLPGGHRTGAPGKHVIRGTSKYRLLDEKVRFFVAPLINDILESPLKPYVHAKLSKSSARSPLGPLGPSGFGAKEYLQLTQKRRMPTVS